MIIDRRVTHRVVFRPASLRAACVLCACALAGCGTELETALSNISLLPTAADISAEVRTACDGVVTEAQMLSNIVAARLDRGNGITKSEEQLTAVTNCTLDALFTGIDIDACTNCKNAILDQVFGE